MYVSPCERDDKDISIWSNFFLPYNRHTAYTASCHRYALRISSIFLPYQKEKMVF